MCESNWNHPLPLPYEPEGSLPPPPPHIPLLARNQHQVAETLAERCSDSCHWDRIQFSPHHVTLLTFPYFLLGQGLTLTELIGQLWVTPAMYEDSGMPRYDQPHSGCIPCMLSTSKIGGTCCRILALFDRSASTLLSLYGLHVCACCGCVHSVCVYNPGLCCFTGSDSHGIIPVQITGCYKRGRKLGEI